MSKYLVDTIRWIIIIKMNNNMNGWILILIIINHSIFNSGIYSSGLIGNGTDLLYPLSNSFSLSIRCVKSSTMSLGERSSYLSKWCNLTIKNPPQGDVIQSCNLSMMSTSFWAYSYIESIQPLIRLVA